MFLVPPEPRADLVDRLVHRLQQDRALPHR